LALIGLFITISKGRREENRIKEGRRNKRHTYEVGIITEKGILYLGFSWEHIRSLQVHLLIISVELETLRWVLTQIGGLKQ
jgi:hypothetical protein